MLIKDYEWAKAYIKDGQFIRQLVVTPSFYLPGAQQDFYLFVRVQLTRPRRENAVPSFKQSLNMKLKFETIPIGQPGQVLASCFARRETRVRVHWYLAHSCAGYWRAGTRTARPNYGGRAPSRRCLR